MLHLLNQDRYDRESIKDILDPVIGETVLASGGSRVLLKPNFVMPAPREDASTTHPEFYLAVAELLMDRGHKVGIGESPAIGTCTKALAAHGVLDECRARNIDVVEFKAPRQFDGVAEDSNYAQLSIASELESWEHLVNLPKLKTHQQFVFTAAAKNLYGCVVGKRKFFRHNLCANDPLRFGRMIIANAVESACTLHIGDGIEALHVKGPRGGETFDLGRIIVSDDFMHHDWLFCRLINLDPADTPLFQAADQRVRDAAQLACKPIVDDDESFSAAEDFIHAPLIHISFSPWAIARSGVRTIRHTLGV